MVQLAQFVRRYVDKECDDTAGTTATAFTSCGAQFTDPDGTVYKLSYVGKITEETDVTTATVKSFDHTFYAYTNAGCGDEGIAKVGSGEREVAVFFYEEGGAVICNDNH